MVANELMNNSANITRCYEKPFRVYLVFEYYRDSIFKFDLEKKIQLDFKQSMEISFNRYC